jgi:hypothetical protein
MVARVGLRRNAYRILVVKSEGKERLGMFRRKWENIKMDFT